MPEFGFTVPGRVPGINELLEAKGARVKQRRHALKLTWSKRVADHALCAKGVRLALTSPATISLHVVEPNRRRDPDNIVGGARKVVTDGLKMAGVLLNDGWKHVSLDSFPSSIAPETGEPKILVRVSWEEP